MQCVIGGEGDLFEVLIVFELHLIHELPVHPESSHAQERLGVLQLAKHILSQHWLHGPTQVLVGLDFFHNGTDSE